MTLANKITFARILMIPLFMWVFLSGMPSSDLWALVIFVVASLTDFVDGYIARNFNQITKLGKFMDPLADKLLVTAAMVCLVELGRLSSWVVVIILSREFIISVFRAVAASDGIVIAASWWGKIKTNVQMAAIVVLLVNNYPFSQWNLPVDVILVILATILTLVSGFDYIWKNRQVLQ